MAIKEFFTLYRYSELDPNYPNSFVMIRTFVFVCVGGGNIHMQGLHLAYSMAHKLGWQKLKKKYLHLKISDVYDIITV